MKKYNVGIIGCTGMVGQRFATLLENHPWFNVTALAASSRSAGKTYKSVVEKRWAMKTPIPTSMADMIILDAVADMDEVVSKVDFVFCAVDMKKDEIRALEEAYAKKECPVVSNNSANRGVEDVPMVVPEINADHIEIINAQTPWRSKKRIVARLLNSAKAGAKNSALVRTCEANSSAGRALVTLQRPLPVMRTLRPDFSIFSISSTRRPARAAVPAAIMPAAPAPTTMTS